MKRLVFIATLALGFSAHAGILLEPHLGYESSTMKLVSTTTDNSGNGTATTVGARLGYKFPMLVWVAADVDYASGTYKVNGATSSDNFTRTTLFGDVGVDLPFLFRFWVGYGFSDKLSIL